jgi:2-C-methyl-D-erythritol 2,4-cyclodiphosphate synthase
LIRVGHGFDVHAFEQGDGIVLGGVNIPFGRGLKAHSDGDVLVHALCDALLGAAGLGDIGRHFPDRDVRYRDIDSRQFLRDIMVMIAADGWQFGNADVTVIAEQPQISPFVAAMVKELAGTIHCQQDQLNIKATTTEKMGPIGRGEGIACHAIVLIHGRGTDYVAN